MIKKARERLKTLLILLLCLGVLVLGYQNWLLDIRLLETPSLSWLAFIPKTLGLYREPLPAIARAQELKPQTALWPSQMAISREGERRGYFNGESSIEMAYTGIASLLGETLGSAHTPEPVGMDAMLTALSGDGIYIEYAHPVPLNLLADWLAFAPTTGLADAVVRIWLADEEGKRVLYYINSRYEAYRAQTPLEYSAPRWQDAQPCYMGYEKAATQRMPYTLLPETQTPIANAAVRDAELSDGYRRAVMTLLGINPELPSYPSVDGSDVYVDESRSISFFPDGRVSYANPASQETARLREDSLPALVEAARLLAVEMEKISGAAHVWFSSAEEQAQAGWRRVVFQYVCNGLVVQGQPALTALFEGAVLRELALHPLYFAMEDQTTLLMPVDMSAQLSGGAADEYVTLSVSYGLDGRARYYKSGWKGR